MANVNGSGFVRWDTTVGATMPARTPKVTQIRMEAGATGGTTTLTVGGATFFSWPIPADSLVTLDYPAGQYMPGLTCSALGTNVIVTVQYV